MATHRPVAAGALSLALVAALFVPSKESRAESRLSEQERSVQEIDARLTALRRRLREKTRLIHRVENSGPRAALFAWDEEDPRAAVKREAALKFMTLDLRESLKEAEALEHRLLEAQTEQEWLRIQSDGSPESPQSSASPLTPSKELRCSASPARTTARERLLVLDGFGAKQDAQSGLEYNSLGWWLGRFDGEVRACAEGTVAFVGPVNGRGQVVMLDHGSGAMTLYANLSNTVVSSLSKGNHIKAGAALGQAAERFYFEVRLAGQPVDPRRALPEGSYTF